MGILCNDKCHDYNTTIKHLQLSLNSISEVHNRDIYSYAIFSLARVYCNNDDLSTAMKYLMMCVNYDNEESIAPIFDVLKNIDSFDVVRDHVKHLFTLITEHNDISYATKKCILNNIAVDINPKPFIDDINKLLLSQKSTQTIPFVMDLDDKTVLTSLIYKLPEWKVHFESCLKIRIGVSSTALNTECPICLSEDLSDHISDNISDNCSDNRYVTLSCKHKICNNCLKLHLGLHYLCPLCKTYIYE